MPKRSNIKKVALGTAVVGALSYLSGLFNTSKSSDQISAADTESEDETFAASLEERLAMLESELAELLSSAAEEAKTIASSEREYFAVSIKALQQAKDKLELIIEALKSGKTEDEDLTQAIKEIKKAIAEAKKFLLKSVA